MIDSEVVYQTPTERWESKRTLSFGDNLIKHIAIGIFGTLGVLGFVGFGFTPAVILVGFPFLAVTLPYMIGTVTLLGMGVVSGMLCSYFDLNNYRDEKTVRADCIFLTTRPLNEIYGSSVIQRMDNLEKYGILSKKTAENIKIVLKKYENCLHVINQPRAPCLIGKNNRFTNHIIEAYKKSIEVYEKAVEEHQQVQIEWNHLQENILEDLPTLDVIA